MSLPRNKEIKKQCCTNPGNYSLRPYSDGTADLICKKCGYVVRAFDAPVESNKETISIPTFK